MSLVQHNRNGFRFEHSRNVEGAIRLNLRQVAYGWGGHITEYEELGIIDTQLLVYQPPGPKSTGCSVHISCPTPIFAIPIITAAGELRTSGCVRKLGEF